MKTAKIELTMLIDLEALKKQKLWLLGHDCSEANGILGILDHISDVLFDNGENAHLLTEDEHENH